MILRESIKNIYRSKGKTAMFFLLIMTLTVAFSLGLNVWDSVSRFLDRCEGNYMTIGLFEYMGPEYPNEDYFDAGMRDTVDSFDFSIIENNKNVVSWDRSYRALGYVDGFNRTDILVPFRKAAVLVVGDVSKYGDKGLYCGTVKESLYSFNDVTGKIVTFYPMGFSFEKGHTYVMHVQYENSGYGNPLLRVAEFENSAAKAAGLESGKYLVRDITDPDGGYTITPDDIFVRMADTYKVINNSVSVFATGNLESLLPFQQQELYIAQGRSFTREDYVTGAHVCVISDLIAEKCGIGVGDEISLSVAVTPNVPVNESYWAGEDFTYRDRYKITGITNSTDQTGHYVFIPKAADMNFVQEGYTLGQAVLANGGADSFYAQTAPLLPDRVHLTIYDQGYSAVTKPFKEIIRIAVIFTFVCGFVTLAVLILFGFLFVYRQRDVSAIMMQLGAGRLRVFGYFLFCSGLVALFAAAAGSTAGFRLSGFTAKLVESIATGYTFSDPRFSSGNLSVAKVLEYYPGSGYKTFIIAGLAILLATLASCLVFTSIILARKNRKRRRSIGFKKSGGSSRLSGGPLSYSALSVIRGGARSFVVPIFCVAAVVFLGHLAYTATGYGKQLGEIYRDTAITGQFTDINGKKANKLVIEAFDLAGLNGSGYISALNVATSTPYLYLGHIDANGNEQQLNHIDLPQTEFGIAALIDKIQSGPGVVYTNNISATPEFLYGAPVTASYMDGYDASFLAGRVTGKPCCMVSTSFMKDNGVKFGDTIRIKFVKQFKDQDLLVVGSYVRQGTKDNIYCQIGAQFNPDLLSAGTDDSLKELYNYTLDSASFKVAASKLRDFKSYLSDYGYSEPNRLGELRSFVVLEDKLFNGTVDALTRQIRYVGVLYPCLYVLIGIISIIVSFLVISGRRKEFAIMRSLGANKSTVFLSFFTEQVTLCLTGCIIGAVAQILFYKALNPLQELLCVGFAICYLAGGAVFTLMKNRPSVMSVLAKED